MLLSTKIKSAFHMDWSLRALFAKSSRSKWTPPIHIYSFPPPPPPPQKKRNFLDRTLVSYGDNLVASCSLCLPYCWAIVTTLFLPVACAYLTAGQVESLAHLLASIHLLLKAKKNVAVSNTAYQYFVER